MNTAASPKTRAAMIAYAASGGSDSMADVTACTRDTVSRTPAAPARLATRCSARSVKMRRMRVSAKSDYALRALIEIATREDGARVSAEELGQLQGIPRGFLQAILADLRRASIVISVRGQNGGWRLAADASTITVADIIRAVDGPLVSVYGLRPESVEYNESATVL